MKNKIEFPCIFDLEENIVSWDQWLIFAEKKLKELGFRKFNQNHKLEDFAYWNVIQNEKLDDLYQIGILFYDFRKHSNNDRIGLMFEVMILDSDRIDMTVSKDVTLQVFEEMAEDFYETMIKYNEKLK